MKILITGGGRGGTNLATELIRSLDIVKFDNVNIEDRKLFDYNIIPNNYGTKLATENKGFDLNNIKRLMDINKDLFIVFVTRHPIDNALSKIYRGRPKSEGGDSNIEEIAPDATKEGSVKSIKHMYSVYELLFTHFGDRSIHIKMEDIIMDKDSVIDTICSFFNISKNEKSKKFYENNRNLYQKNRYGNNLDNSQIDLYKNLEVSFNGYFKEDNNIEYISNELSDIIKKLGY